MYCKNCGNQLPEGAKFCDDCGCPTEKRETNSKKPKRTGVKALLVFCIVALVLGGVGMAVYFILGNVENTVENQEEKPADQTEEPENAEKIDIACGLGMEWEEFNREVVQEEFERKVYNGVDWCMENQEKGIICSLADEDDDTIWLINW